jgi:hypothetical protein
MTTHNGKRITQRGGMDGEYGKVYANGKAQPRWVMEKMTDDYADEQTGQHAWGVTDTHTKGYGHDTFDTHEKALRYAEEMNNRQA